MARLFTSPCRGKKSLSGRSKSTNQGVGVNSAILTMVSRLIYTMGVT